MNPFPTNEPVSSHVEKITVLKAGDDLIGVALEWTGDTRAAVLLAAGNDLDRLRGLPIGTRLHLDLREPPPFVPTTKPRG